MRESRYFYSMLNSNFREAHESTVAYHDDPWAWNEMLSFFCQNYLQIDAQDPAGKAFNRRLSLTVRDSQALSVLVLADKYEIPNINTRAKAVIRSLASRIIRDKTPPGGSRIARLAHFHLRPVLDALGRRYPNQLYEWLATTLKKIIKVSTAQNPDLTPLYDLLDEHPKLYRQLLHDTTIELQLEKTRHQQTEKTLQAAFAAMNDLKERLKRPVRGMRRSDLDAIIDGHFR